MEQNSRIVLKVNKRIDKIMSLTILITKTLKDNIFILLILILATVLLSININKPFIGHHDWNGAFWGVQARYYLSFFGSLLSIQNNVSFGGIFFSHYTPLLPALFSISVAIFGERELSLRLVPLIFSVVMVFIIYKIGSAYSHYENISILCLSHHVLGS